MRIMGLICFLAIVHGGSFGQSDSHNRDSIRALLDRVELTGRELYTYDWAVRTATDAILSRYGHDPLVNLYLASRLDQGWRVGFGSLTDERAQFLLSCEVTLDSLLQVQSVVRHETPIAERGTFFSLARAVALSLPRLGKTTRPYNYAVLPADSDLLHVYMFPAQTDNNSIPLGGDRFVTVSRGSGKLLGETKLHNSIIDFTTADSVVAGYHSHVLHDMPVATDVFFVLCCDPPRPHHIITQSRVFIIDTDGSISSMSTEVYLKLP